MGNFILNQIVVSNTGGAVFELVALIHENST